MLDLLSKQLLFCYLATVVLLFTVLFFIQSKVLFLLFRQQIFLYYKHIYILLIKQRICFVIQTTVLIRYSDTSFVLLFRQYYCFVIHTTVLFFQLLPSNHARAIRSEAFEQRSQGHWTSFASLFLKVLNFEFQFFAALQNLFSPLHKETQTNVVFSFLL